MIIDHSQGPGIVHALGHPWVDALSDETEASIAWEQYCSNDCDLDKSESYHESCSVNRAKELYI